MRKIKFISALVVFFVGLTAFAAGNRAAIDKFLKSYEEFVVATEKAAKTNSMMDLIKLEEKAVKMAEEADKIENSADWTLQDSKKYLELTNRYSKAVSSMTNTATPTVDLSAYGL